MGNFFHNATGIANGVAITSANSGTAPDTAYPSTSGVSTANTGTVTSSTAAPLYGGSSQRELFTCAAGQLAFVEDGVIAVAPGTADVYSWIVDFGGAAAPAAVAPLVSWRNAGEVCRLTMDTSGILRLFVGANFTAGAYAWISTAGALAGDRIYVGIQPGTSTSNGSAAVTIFAGNTTTPRSGGTFSSAALNIGTTNIVGSRRGIAQAAAATIGYTQVRHITGGTLTDPGVYAAGANVAPTVTPGATQTVLAGTVVTLTATAADSDGTVSSLTGAFTVSPGAAPTLTGSATGTGTASSAALSQTATLAAVGRYVWTATGTDNSGAATTAITTIYVYAASGTSADPVAVGSTVWTTTGAGSPLAALTGTAAPSTKYVETPTGPTGQTLPITLAPQGAGALTIYVEGYYNAGALTRTLTLFKADGTTQVDTVSFALPSADTEYSWTVSVSQLNAIIPAATDRQALILTIADA